MRRLEQNESATVANPKAKVGVPLMGANEFEKTTLKQICIWLPIILGLILFATILALVEMPIQKNSILYAKYGTTKTQINQ
jgi:hypothetical protein